MNVQALIRRQLTEEGSEPRECGPHQCLCILQWSDKVFCWSSVKMRWYRPPSGYWMGEREDKENSWRWGQGKQSVQMPPSGDLRPRWPTQHLYLDCPLNSLPNLCELGIIVFILQLGTWGTEEKQPKIVQEGRRRQALEQSHRSLVPRRHNGSLAGSQPQQAWHHRSDPFCRSWSPESVWLCDLSKLDSSHVKDITGIFGACIFIIWMHWLWRLHVWQDFLSSFSKAGGKANECSDYHYKDKNGEDLLNSFNKKEPSYACLYRRFNGLYSTHSVYLLW